MFLNSHRHFTTFGLVALGAIAACPSPVLAQAQPGHSKPVVQVIDPMTVHPLYSIAPWVAGGPAAHRRVVTRSENGAVLLDIGYNTYNKGVRLANPYAYTTDEICFIPSGHIHIQSDGKIAEYGPRSVAWRPAGASTDWAEFTEDTVTICAMSPARLNANGHRVPAQDVGKWAGAGPKPTLHWYDATKARLIKASSPGVEQREVLSRRQDGSTKVSDLYIAMKKGARLPMGRAGAQICWVERGSVRLITADGPKTVATRSFFYRPEGATINRVEALSAVHMNCWNAPAAL